MRTNQAHSSRARIGVPCTDVRSAFDTNEVFAVVPYGSGHGIADGEIAIVAPDVQPVPGNVIVLAVPTTPQQEEFALSLHLCVHDGRTEVDAEITAYGLPVDASFAGVVIGTFTPRHSMFDAAVNVVVRPEPVGDMSVGTDGRIVGIE